MRILHPARRRGSLASLAALTLLGVLCAPAATAATKAPPTRLYMHVACQVDVQKLTSAARAKLTSPRAIVSLCDDRALRPSVRTASIVAGPCGTSWMYDQKLGQGWITEYAGVNIIGWYGGIRYGGAVLKWYNYSQRGYFGSEPATIYPSSGLWDDVHNVYTHRGTIGSWLNAAVMTGRGIVCSNYPNQPFDFVNV